MTTPQARLGTPSRRKRVLALAAPLLVLLAAAEITGRMLERHAGYMPRRAATYAAGNPYLRTALVPGTRFRSGTYRVDVNQHGFRGPELAVPKESGTFRIFAVGESTTFGWKGAVSHEQAWPALLETRLRAAHPGRRIEVVNAGVPGYTSVEQRVNFMLRIATLEPDAILVYHGNNDINWSWVPDVETKLVYGRGESVAPPGWMAKAVDHSYVAMELRSRLDLFTREDQDKRDDVDEAALRMLRGNLRWLVDDARRHGVLVALATFAHALDESGTPGEFSEDERRLGVPNVGRWFEHLGPQGARRTFPAYNEMVRDLASTDGLPLVDIARRVPPTPEYHTDWCHFTARGEELMAQLWQEVIESAGWLSARAS